MKIVLTICLLLAVICSMVISADVTADFSIAIGDGIKITEPYTFAYSNSGKVYQTKMSPAEYKIIINVIHRAKRNYRK